MSEVLARDKAGRPLVVMRDNGMILFTRYHDLSAEEKDKLVEFYRRLKENAEIGIQSDTDLRAFLDFKTDPSKDICG